MEEDDPSRPANGGILIGPGETLKFHYIKSNMFRVIHAEGAFGGPTPRGYISVGIYNERAAIPQVTEMQFDEKGKGAPEKIIETKSHIVREVEVELIFDLPSAKIFASWLTNKTEEVERALSEMGEPSNKAKI